MLLGLPQPPLVGLAVHGHEHARRARPARRPGRVRPPTWAVERPSADTVRARTSPSRHVARRPRRPAQPPGGRRQRRRCPRHGAAPAPARTSAGVGAGAEQQAQPGHDHGLAGAGLAGDDVEARAELEHGVVDDAEALDPQFLEHGPTLSRAHDADGEPAALSRRGSSVVAVAVAWPARAASSQPGLAAPALDRQVELGHEPVGERRGRQPGQAHRRLAARTPRSARRGAGRPARGRRTTARRCPRVSGTTSTASWESGPSTSGRANSAWALIGTSSSASTSGQTTGPPGGEGVGRRAGGGGARRRRRSPSVDSGRPSISSDHLEHPLAGGLLDGHLVERPADAPPTSPSPGDARRRGSSAPRRCSRASTMRSTVALEVLALGLGEEADVAEVDPEQRRVGAAGHLGAAQDRAVAAEHARPARSPRAGVVGSAAMTPSCRCQRRRASASSGMERAPRSPPRPAARRRPGRRAGPR